MTFLRSLLFNLVFFSWTAVYCFLIAWTLVMPRPVMLAMIRFYMRTLTLLERTIIGLRYEVKGIENLPKEGAYLVGAKHQSMWETMKLHLMFRDPAIVLKHELIYIPLWGWFAWKAQMIPVKRGKRGAAIASLVRGARAMKAMGREIVIFPQGTRVAVGEYRPYKVGIAVLYEDLGVPLVPMALNSGVFWGRKTFIKRPGLITIEFLPPIPPGLPKDVALFELEARLESASNRLAVAVGGEATLNPSAASPAAAPVPETDSGL
ncbi:1-acyl-sn-glycerol-3-phosphate acyltransferase [Niveispirillum lacus]|uniref:1-acyl-sn-glycerol-3-phosphate acyltransferase n=1 Tax=Niveispirillum lacus TaxID=1981099 RepID=A0A255Z4L4_9PROT|nr:lysophospholipid acyltransferase family protein [Niveispirillum lacus]OYQ36396.1 1-acyl-sn-glycerol-3-phosphate acyltransferase [Niveispirillum lacus]